MPRPRRIPVVPRRGSAGGAYGRASVPPIHSMRFQDVTQRLTTPLDAPAYPRGPYRFTDREYFTITYRTDPRVLERLVPEPLRVAEPTVRFEVMRMPDTTGSRGGTRGWRRCPWTAQTITGRGRRTRLRGARSASSGSACEVGAHSRLRTLSLTPTTAPADQSAETTARPSAVGARPAGPAESLGRLRAVRGIQGRQHCRPSRSPALCSCSPSYPIGWRTPSGSDWSRGCYGVGDLPSLQGQTLAAPGRVSARRDLLGEDESGRAIRRASWRGAGPGDRVSR
ncbi:acetoacetate decarboxylase family protein [Streptomyces sp. NPDC002758]